MVFIHLNSTSNLSCVDMCEMDVVKAFFTTVDGGCSTQILINVFVQKLVLLKENFTWVAFMKLKPSVVVNQILEIFAMHNDLQV